MTDRCLLCPSACLASPLAHAYRGLKYYRTLMLLFDTSLVFTSPSLRTTNCHGARSPPISGPSARDFDPPIVSCEHNRLVRVSEHQNRTHDHNIRHQNMYNTTIEPSISRTGNTQHKIRYNPTRSHYTQKTPASIVQKRRLRASKPANSDTAIPRYRAIER